LRSRLADTFSKTYGYRGDEGGTGYAILEEPGLDAADARFFLVSRSALINYLKAQMQAGAVDSDGEAERQ
jgi:hypothetical protein